MTQERIEQPNRPVLDVTIFQPQTVNREIQLYRGTLDPDERALVLNKDIIRSEDGIATPGSVRILALISAEETREVTQYRPDSVVALNTENLVAVVNGLASDMADKVDPLFSAVRRIQQTQGRAMLWEAGINDQTGIRDEDIINLRTDTYGEMAERLNDIDMDFVERRNLIACISATITPEALAEISKNPEALAAFIRHQREFTSDELRQVLEVLQKRQDI